MKNSLCFLLITLFLPQLAISQVLTAPADSLPLGFQPPPASAMPVRWWHWINSNVTKEGITKDLEWMKRVGIGGFQLIDVSIGGGQSVDKKIVFFTPEWFDAVRHTAAEAKRLGLDMTMVTSAGWSETGGPWVKPQEAIKKVVWSETRMKGGKKIIVKLPQPPSVNGPVRNMKRIGFGMSGNSDTGLYSDEIVLAYPTPKEESDMTAWKPAVSSNAGPALDSRALTDDDLSTGISLPAPKADTPTWIQFAFDKPFTARAFSLGLRQSGMFGSSSIRPGYVQASDDGKSFRTLLAFPGPQHDIRALPVRTFSFPAVTARYFRVVFTPGSGITTVGGPDDVGGFGRPSTPPAAFDLTEAVFYSGGRVNRWEDKANFAPMFQFETLATPSVSEPATIRPAQVLDLSSRMSQDGTLNWEAPAGDWTILRMGYALTGSKNGPAVPAGTGLEVDKLSRKHLESYYRSYAGPIAQALGPLFGQSMKYWLVDSYEADAQNWTEELSAEFRKRRGYDPMPYLPALAGRIVESAEVSDRFLWDFRRTIADLLAENHYAVLTGLAHQHGLKTYGEVGGISLPIIQDALMNKGRVDVPMGEFGMTQGLGSGSAMGWKSPSELESDHAYRGAGDRLNAHQADVREAASAAHIYGKKVVAAESWTGGDYEAPASLKLIGDYWNTQGINQFIFHTSAHQPLDTKPGNAMVGTHINRNMTWAEQAGPFMTYLARNQYLLQQGQFVADIAYYLGESIPSAVPYWEKITPEPPAGYDYDFINTEILLDSMTVKDGRLVLSNGMSYPLLVLPPTEEMTPHVLRKVRDLVAAGATVAGPKPLRSPSLAGYPAVDRELSLMANEIWGDADGRMVFGHEYGKGKVYWGVPLAGILAEKQVPKDVAYTRPHINTLLSWIHRRTSDADIYFFVNLRNQEEDLQVQLRTSGRIPELWHADDGTIKPASYRIADGMTTVSLHMAPQESVFIVLRRPAQTQQWLAPEPGRREAVTINGPWELRFPAGLGAPERIVMDSLSSWTEHPEAGVKYFSGTAVYNRALPADASWLLPGNRIWIDLGDVRDLAEVLVNGKSVGLLWKAPYRADISEMLKAGSNQLEIRVTNQWTNRISGDRLLPADKKILAGSGFGFGPAGQLKASGLIGPVRLIREK